MISSSTLIVFARDADGRYIVRDGRLVIAAEIPIHPSSWDLLMPLTEFEIERQSRFAAARPELAAAAQAEIEKRKRSRATNSRQQIAAQSASRIEGSMHTADVARIEDHRGIRDRNR